MNKEENKTEKITLLNFEKMSLISELESVKGSVSSVGFLISRGVVAFEILRINFLDRFFCKYAGAAAFLAIVFLSGYRYFYVDDAGLVESVLQVWVSLAVIFAMFFLVVFLPFSILMGVLVRLCHKKALSHYDAWVRVREIKSNIEKIENQIKGILKE